MLTPVPRKKISNKEMCSFRQVLTRTFYPSAQEAEAEDLCEASLVYRAGGQLRLHRQTVSKKTRTIKRCAIIAVTSLPCTHFSDEDFEALNNQGHDFEV